MPKTRTHHGAAKRVKRTGSGQLKRSGVFTFHLFTNKNIKQERRLCKAKLVSRSGMKHVKQSLAYKK